MNAVAHIMRRKAPPHFAARVRERIGRDVCPNRLFVAIIAAVATGAEEYVERVKQDPRTNCNWYRVGTPFGRFYVPMVTGDDGTLYPKTIYTHEMWRKKRAAIKARKKSRSRKGWKS